MAAATYDFVINDEGKPFIEQGATFTVPLVWKDSNGRLVDLTGYTARMQIRASVSAPDVLLELTSGNGRIVLDIPTATITLKLTATETAAITWTKGVYDLEMMTSQGAVTRLLQGQVSVSKEVTR